MKLIKKYFAIILLIKFILDKIIVSEMLLNTQQLPESKEMITISKEELLGLKVSVQFNADKIV